MPIIRSSRVIQIAAACGTWLCKDGNVIYKLGSISVL